MTDIASVSVLKSVDMKEVQKDETLERIKELRAKVAKDVDLVTKTDATGITAEQEQMLRIQYLKSFAIYILNLDAKYTTLMELRDSCKTKDSKFERLAIIRKMNGVKVNISKAGSLWNAIASGRAKPWLFHMEMSLAANQVKGK